MKFDPQNENAFNDINWKKNVAAFGKLIANKTGIEVGWSITCLISWTILDRMVTTMNCWIKRNVQKKKIIIKNLKLIQKIFTSESLKGNCWDKCCSSLHGSSLSFS